MKLNVSTAKLLSLETVAFTLCSSYYLVDFQTPLVSVAMCEQPLLASKPVYSSRNNCRKFSSRKYLVSPLASARVATGLGQASASAYAPARCFWCELEAETSSLRPSQWVRKCFFTEAEFPRSLVCGSFG